MAISTSTATQAIDALMKWKNTQSESHNPQLLPQDDFLYLVLTLKKIPQKGSENGVRTNPYKIPLPHPLISATGFSELCLIVDDRPNSKLTSQIAKKKIKEDGISVTKVIKLSKLKTDYRPFEAKRKLCDSYEMFFADKRVIPLLPKLLGKQFFKKKKLPLPIDLSHKNWKEQIERACSAALLFFSTGTVSVVRVAKVSMERDEIIENVNAAIEGIIELVPKKLTGVRSLHLKLSESVSLPLYQSLPDMKLRIEGVKEMKTVEEEVVKTEVVGKKKKSKQERIHEVNHDLDDEEDNGGEIENNDTEVKQTKKEQKGAKDDKKKRKGNVVEETDVKTDGSNKKAKKANKKVEGDGEEVKKIEEVAKKANKKVEGDGKEVKKIEEVAKKANKKVEGDGKEVKKIEEVAKKANKKVEGDGEEVKKNEEVAKKTKKKVKIVEEEVKKNEEVAKKTKKKMKGDGEEVKKSEEVAKKAKKNVESVGEEVKKNEESGKKKKSQQARSHEGKKKQV